uniref:Cytochrome c oxidase subunit 2 n=144 Tax=Anisakidae TaxID=6267 RepID=A0A023HTS9_ANISI|nr:cytochrome c oxidase subunit II [Anisakis berlandi]YP_009355297.1 cytochrome c oxidase subunit II [Anisakis pegreffii]AES86038.1 cytochrome c oxidase subunit II [Anisakis simplex]AES86026.1 cytochrome c oxidase subunit II [Anisakis berlandi]AES86050.1 cytochrome c oxidase subunit II [Anisakis simplex]AES86062.1 cytochrome c oxidase subunit II [Anisakis simplex]AES86074.1 cytochrome c oxidase subunit II [Anisakis simplex]
MNNFFQDFGLMFSNSLFSSYMDWFHNFNCSLLFGVLSFVSVMFGYLLFSNFYFKSKKIEYQFGELLCSIFPTLILVAQMVPSLSLLYYYGLMNLDSNLTVKVTGHQWYWSYEFSDIPGLEFDSYMKSVDQLELGEPRLLEVDNRCVVPCDINVRFCITSGDVIHSWALPSMSIKLDAMSGILSTVSYSFPTVGVFYGQCSEICGANHSFMPIALEVTLLDNFKSWCMGFMEN